MANMGRYCKAYPIERFRAYGNWSEKLESARGHLYLQENYVVADGVFLDQRIVFDDVTPEWIDFCKNTLKFELPQHISAKNDEATPQSGQRPQKETAIAPSAPGA